MGNKSGVSDRIISLPEGGGTLSGLGEKFSPDRFTGTGNFTVPIDLPAGRNEFQPELSLTYSTGQGNGPFGLGWALDVPGVSRKTADGIPRYDDVEDTFVLSGAEDLVPIAPAGDRTGADGPAAYRPRTEGNFARIRRHGDPDTDHWVVRSTDGLESTYGTPERRGRDPATTADPSDPERVFAWHPTRTEDPYGNHVVYEYRPDAGDDGAHRWDRPLLDRIRYVDVGAADEPAYLVSVSFQYEDRPDPFSDYRAGFERRTTKRCKRIAIRMHAGEDELVRTYDFTYLDERPGGEVPPNGVSLLTEVAVTGHDEERTQRLPPLEFGYTEFEPSEREFSPLEGSLPNSSLAAPDVDLADLFGNGLPDIVEIGETVRYWRNLGRGKFDDPRSMRRAPAGLRLGDSGVQLIDANGDGRVDLLATADGLAGYFPLGFEGEWDADSFQRFEVAPSVDLDDSEVALVDLDGDGVTDAIRSGSQFECFFNDPREGWTETRRVPRGDSESFPDVTFSDPRVKWGDFSGDGSQDIALAYDGNVDYWPNLGHGEWGNRVRMRDGPRLPRDYDPARLLVGDVDGDGLADLVYVEDDRVHLWINRSGNRWSDSVTIDGTPSVADADAVRLVDLHGTGVAGLLWSADDRGPEANAFFLDFTGGTKPYLLDEMNNRSGAITRVAYASSTNFYLADQRRPETRWRTSLPFPVQVVARVEAIDAIAEGKLTTEYRYRHGHWDGAEREFRGFGMVEEVDSETFDDYNDAGLHAEERRFAEVGTTDREQFSPPTVTKTWFHQGPVGDEFGDWEEPDYGHEYWAGDPQVLSRPDSMRELLGRLSRRARRDALRTLRGRVLRTELYAADGSAREGRPSTVAEHLHGVREEQPPAAAEDRRRIFFPHALATRTTEWERGTDPKTRFTFTGRYDDYGQPRSGTEIAVPRGRDPLRALDAAADAEPYLATCEGTEYARRDDGTTYIVDRIARTTTHEIENDGREDVFALQERIDRAIDRGTLPEASIVGQTVNFYDGDMFSGRPFGTLGEHGALVRTETLALTDEVLHGAYERDGAGSIPPYLTADAGTEWDDYPADARTEYARGFVDRLPLTESVDLTRPGLRVTPTGHGASDGENDPYAAGYFVASKRCAYDFQTDPDGEGRGLVTARRDELGRDTTIAYDEFDLLPTSVVDAAGLETTARYDYRVFRPAEHTDPNGNVTAYAYAPLGLLERVAVTGKADEEEGDTLSEPGTRYRYDLRAFEEHGAPISVETIRRERHRWDLFREDPGADPDELFPPDELGRFPERFLRTREYSDGFGRLVQTRTQAEDVVFGDPTFGGDELLVDQAVLVRDGDPDGSRPETLANVAGREVGIETGTVGARLVETLAADSDLPESSSRGYGSARAAVTALEDGTVDAVIVDESLAIEFAKRGTVDVALTTGPGEVVGRERSGEDPPRVVVSGWRTYDNKGEVVEQYEPFFDRGFEFRSRGETPGDERGGRIGQKLTTYYDPHGRVVRTVTPNGSEERVVRGVPADLEDPDGFEPSPWEAYTYDANDNAERTHGAALGAATGRYLRPPDAYRHHWNTPSTDVVDALGRTVETIERTRDDPDDPPEKRRTRSTYDLRDNVLAVTDALDREAFRYDYDLQDETLRAESIDAGVRLTVLDAAGNELERRDGKGALVLRAYDELSRPVRLWARDAEAEALTLREHLVYGDSPEVDEGVDGAARNLLGELYRHYDEAGLLTFERYDFKGNVLQRRRRVIGDDVVLAGRPVDWRPPDGTALSAHAAELLESEVDGAPGSEGYPTGYAYDALDRAVRIRYPEDVDGDRKELRPRYDRAGDLRAVDLVRRPETSHEEVEPYVEHVAYDAKGQRTFVAYGNGVMTRYAYDPETFRLTRLRTDDFANPDGFTYRPGGTVLQDYAYEYDLAGNVTTIRDRTPDGGILDSPLGRHALDREFEYDPLYRLLAATGRECGSVANRDPWDGRPRCADLTRTRAYEERYRYDPAGNLTELAHTSGERERDAPDDGRFTRLFSIASESNRLASMTIGETEYDYAYDAAGNLRREGAGRRYEWDHGDRLRAFRSRANGGEPSLRAHYRYDAAGQRVVKLVEKSGGHLERTVYVDGVFEHHTVTQGDETRENNALHVMDDERRVALVRVGDPIRSDAAPAVTFHLHDHLSGSSAVVDRNGDLINSEEYTPYGETSFGSFARKRYRFTGKERDEESGLYYGGARSYAPWQARWTSTDPIGPADGSNLYAYARNNPVRNVDSRGFQSEDQVEEGVWSEGELHLSYPAIDVFAETDEVQSADGQQPEETSDNIDASGEGSAGSTVESAVTAAVKASKTTGAAARHAGKTPEYLTKASNFLARGRSVLSGRSISDTLSTAAAVGGTKIGSALETGRTGRAINWVGRNLNADSKWRAANVGAAVAGAADLLASTFGAPESVTNITGSAVDATVWGAISSGTGNLAGAGSNIAAEGLERGLATTHEQNVRGERGGVVQGWAMIGEVVSEGSGAFEPTSSLSRTLTSEEAKSGKLGFFVQTGSWLGERLYDLTH